MQAYETRYITGEYQPALQQPGTQPVFQQYQLSSQQPVQQPAPQPAPQPTPPQQYQLSSQQPTLQPASQQYQLSPQQPVPQRQYPFSSQQLSSQQPTVQQPTQAQFLAQSSPQPVVAPAISAPVSTALSPQEISLLAYILGVVDPERDLGWARKQEETDSEKKGELQVEIKKSWKFLYAALAVAGAVSVIVLVLVWKYKMKAALESPEPSQENRESRENRPEKPSHIASFLTTGLSCLLAFAAVVDFFHKQRSEKESAEGNEGSTEKMVAEIREKSQLLLKSYIQRLRTAGDDEISRSVKYLSKRTHFKGVENPKRDEMVALLFAEEVKRGLDSC